ncbi:hypothetical protein [Photobacterium leiognathi]|uniref:hypothetical protein n=1 Tax=Photobacterium leiognathi TaxID=553611 RepID=UPI002981AE84|nr:hypothetical protein [Photobacterium leiognathi]
MSRYDLDNIFRDLSKINEMTNPVRNLNKSFVNCNERMGLSSVSRYPKQLDNFNSVNALIESVRPNHQNTDTDPQLINLRKRTENKYNIKSESVQIGDSYNINIHNSFDEITKSGDEVAKGILKRLLENNTVANILGVVVAALITCIFNI